MVDKAHRLTDKKLEEMERHLSAIYSEAQKGIAKNWTEYLKKSNKEIGDLQKAYDEAKRIGDKDKMRSCGISLQKAKKEKTLLNEHYKNLTKKTAEEFFKVNQIATAYINGELPEIYALNYNALARTVDGVGGYVFELVYADTIKYLATTDDVLLPIRELNKKKDIAWNMKKINSQVLQGILTGESMDKIAKRISTVQKMNKEASIRSARTIVTGAENKGRLDSYKRAEENGIILKKRWLSSNQRGRTRDWHMPHAFRSLEVDIDEPFVNDMGKIMFPGDPSAKGANVYNCRCSMRAVVKGFKKAQVKR